MSALHSCSHNRHRRRIGSQSSMSPRGIHHSIELPSPFSGKRIRPPTCWRVQQCHMGRFHHDIGHAGQSFDDFFPARVVTQNQWVCTSSSKDRISSFSASKPTWYSLRVNSTGGDGSNTSCMQFHVSVVRAESEDKIRSGTQSNANNSSAARLASRRPRPFRGRSWSDPY